MSRTYRKRLAPYKELDFNNPAYYWYIKWYYKKNPNIEKAQEREKALYYSDKKNWNYRSISLPQWFRNSVNRTRRRKDKIEIWKAMNLSDYAEQCSKWNCKDNNAWGYW